jgi:hypothetical protein
MKSKSKIILAKERAARAVVVYVRCSTTGHLVALPAGAAAPRQQAIVWVLAIN